MIYEQLTLRNSQTKWNHELHVSHEPSIFHSKAPPLGEKPPTFTQVGLDVDSAFKRCGEFDAARKHVYALHSISGVAPLNSFFTYFLAMGIQAHVLIKRIRYFVAMYVDHRPRVCTCGRCELCIVTCMFLL